MNRRSGLTLLQHITTGGNCVSSPRKGKVVAPLLCVVLFYYFVKLCKQRYKEVKELNHCSDFFALFRKFCCQCCGVSGVPS